MMGIDEMCNHVAAAEFWVKATVRTGLTNPPWPSSANKWLPCRKVIEPIKILEIFKIPGMKFVNPNIPVWKYGRDIDIEAVNKFAKYIKNYHRDCFISQCGWVLDKTMPYIGKIRDLLYCGKTCIVIKLPYSINYAEPNE